MHQVVWENLVRAEAVQRREEAAAEAEELQRAEEHASLDHVQMEEKPGGDGKGLTSKQARVQALMRDANLSPQERQMRIQQVMREPAEPPKEEEEGEGGGGGESKQQRIQAVMKDTYVTTSPRCLRTLDCTLLLRVCYAFPPCPPAKAHNTRTPH